MLAAIAYPSYRQYAVRSNRTEAKVALMQTSQALEKCYTRYMAYNHDECDAAGQFKDGGSYDTPDGNYRVTGAIAAQGYLLNAAPLGGQQDDAQCGSLRLDETGTRAQTGTASVQTCW
jgi:type IV pilus assembly protein PilE